LSNQISGFSINVKDPEPEKPLAENSFSEFPDWRPKVFFSPKIFFSPDVSGL